MALTSQLAVKVVMTIDDGMARTLNTGRGPRGAEAKCADRMESTMAEEGSFCLCLDVNTDALGQEG